MAFKSKITCDSDGCSNEMHIAASHPSDIDVELEAAADKSGGWLFDYINESHFCPSHAFRSPNEFELVYDPRDTARLQLKFFREKCFVTLIQWLLMLGGTTEHKFNRLQIK
jgi:hypothetical protein